VYLRRRTASRLALAVLTVGLAVWTLAQVIDRRDESLAAEALRHQAEALGAALKSASEAAHVRAEALAALPVVRAAIETDVTTVKDIERSSNVFIPAPGESIELYQLGTRTVSLLRAPESARPLRLDGSEVQRAGDDRLEVTVSARVMPMYEAGHDGAMAVRRPVALDELKERLAAHGLVATLTGLDAPVVLISDGKGRSVGSMARAVPFGPMPSLRLQAARRSSGAGALGLVGIVLFGLGLAGAAAVAAWQLRAPVLVSRTSTTGVTPIVRLPHAERPGAPAGAEELDSLPQLVPMQAEASPRLEVPADPLIAGRYRVIQSIGAGRDSEVYLAQTVQQVGVPKVVALKLHRPQAQLAPEQFLESLQQASRLNAPDLVRIYDCGIDAQRFYVAMEYVEGCSAQCLLDELGVSHEAMPIKQSLAIAIGVCRALTAAHELKVGGLAVPVLHRDLRPSSVLIGRHGAVKLSDFGAARARLTSFTAPELARGGVADPRSDLYSLGMVLGELVRGLQLPRSLEAVIAKATNAAPKRRYASADQLRADLEDVAEAVVEPPSSGVLVDWVERVRRSHAGGRT
jgi:hypothetical protein